LNQWSQSFEKVWSFLKSSFIPGGAMAFKILSGFLSGQDFFIFKALPF